MIHICPEMYFHIKILFIAYFIYNFIQTESSVFQQEVGGFMIQKIHHLRSQVSNPRQNGQPLFEMLFLIVIKRHFKGVSTESGTID